MINSIYKTHVIMSHLLCMLCVLLRSRHSTSTSNAVLGLKDWTEESMIVGMSLAVREPVYRMV